MEKLKALLMAGAFALPVQQMSDWQVLEYSGLKANQVEFVREGMSVMVEDSASPIIYPLPETKRVKRVEVEGFLSDLLRLRASSQGGEGDDDFGLKIGLVVEGDRTLNPLQRLVSAKWIKTLFDLAPDGTGVDRIHFLNAVQYHDLLGQKRQHPLSDLIFEHNVWVLDRPGDFKLEHDLEQPLDVIAVWVSIDGDDSGSRYTTLIKRLVLDS